MESMDIDEDILNCFFDESQKISRNYQNSKITNNQIYKNDELLRIKSDNNNYYKRQEMQNDNIKYLISCSNFIFYNAEKNCNSIYEAKQQIKNKFNIVYEKQKSNKIINENDFPNELKLNKDKIFKEKFKDNLEYKNLSELINQKDFDDKMKKDEEFRNSIFLDKFFIYNEKSQDIINKYSNLLPKFIYNIIQEKFENNKNNFF